MRLSSHQSLFVSTATPSAKYHDRRYTLIWGPNGQPSLVGFDPLIGTQPAVAPVSGFHLLASCLMKPSPNHPHIQTVSATQNPLVQSSSPQITRATTQLAHSASKTPVSSIPDLAVTTTSPTDTSSNTVAPTSSSISVTSTPPFPSISSSITPTDTDTSIPSIPTIVEPTPSPTVRSTDHGYGAPFYLAIVLGTLFGIACISAIVAWWIKSRARRKRHSELDPWYDREHGQEPSLASDHDGLSSLTSAERREIDGEMQTPEYYLPASLVRRSTTNLLALPYAAPTPTDERVLHNNIGRSGLAQGPYPPLRASNNLNLQMQSPYYGMPSSQVPKPRSRPNPGRLATGLSVQESTRTLGRLRVANIMPGDVTSGDEGGISRPGLGEDVGLTPPSTTGGLGTAVITKDRDNPARGTKVNRRDQSDSLSEGPVEPPGPATVPWGRRTSTVAALRRTRRSPGTTAKTYKNPNYGGYYHQMADPAPSPMTHLRPSPNPQGWTNTLKSSFWNVVETVAGNRPPPSLDHEPQAGTTGSGSNFTPTPRRALSQRSLDRHARPDYFGTGSSISLARTRSASSLVARDRVNALHDILDGPLTGGVTHYPRDQTYIPGPPQALSSSTLQGYSQSQSTLQSEYEDSQIATADSHRPGYGTTSTWAMESQAALLGNEAPMGTITPHLPLASSNMNAANPDRHSSLPENARHPYSLRTETRSMYSTDSAAASANLRKYGYGITDQPLAPSPMPSHLALPISPSRLATQSTFQSDCLSTLSRLRSGSSSLGSENRTTHSGNGALNTDNGTLQSGSDTPPPESAPFRLSSTTSARLVRKKGVTTQRKRPQHIQRVSSTASSMLSIESGSVGLSIREEAARRALLARRRLAVVGGAEKVRA
ncbi:hypothetical protein PAXRUDRAFT_17064 [Paxillus rubicundulus Ve08.2h10]|uniref:Uncharacterized protein n=1 Tax=Paxillus rubicundulus Ve08.2h10 TaxID=930991 RepID=A0A0D0D3G6_9AGAM|nr:hypothetical protein PAXRUDRAFT_17064 [Paxillus rubicundulus Ve08.2h10]